jgi:hypothetical protein
MTVKSHRLSFYAYTADKGASKSVIVSVTSQTSRFITLCGTPFVKSTVSVCGQANKELEIITN